MLALSAIAAAFASVALAHPHRRFEGITVELSAPSSSVSSIDELSFTAAITNTNSEAVKVLKYGTVLDGLPSRSFSVSKDGADVAFTGAKVCVLNLITYVGTQVSLALYRA